MGRGVDQNMQGTPQQPDPTRPGVGIPIKVRFSEPAHVDEAIPNQPARQEQRPRRMRIMPYKLGKYGFTEGCEGYRHKQAGLQGARDHSETCRVRIMEAVRQDTSDFGARKQQRHRNETERMGRRDLHPEESQKMEHPEVLDHGRSHEGSAASSTDAVKTRVDDAGLSPDVDVGLILNEGGMRCLLSIQATDTIGGDSKRDQGVAHEEDESLDHWPLRHGTTSRGRCGKVQLQYSFAQGQGHQSHGARRRLRVCRLALFAEAKVIGKGEGEVSEARVLSRILRVSTHGWEYEGDQRHAELIVKALKLESAKSVSTPR